jgi:predicted dehydrogenase
MASASDGMNYAPQGKPAPVLRDGESFTLAVAAMDHGHIHGQVNGLVEAGAKLKYVYDANDPAKAKAMAEKFGAQHVTELQPILDDAAVDMVTAAAIPNVRAELGIRCMDAGKHYFTDKTPLTTLGQLRDVWSAVERTGKKYMVYYSERLHVESAMHAGTLIQQGAIGRVIHVEGFGPHRMGEPSSRPDWFFRKRQYGGILNDIGSHQIEQFLHYAGCKDATVTAARVGNYGNPGFPELEDFGDCTLTGDNGATMYFRVDWFTPKNAKVWGDGRTFILGTQGYIELRKYRDIATEHGPGNVLLMVNADGETRMELSGKVGFKFFGQLIRDCLDGTDHAMTQAHALKAAELCVKAQLYADSQRMLG